MKGHESFDRPVIKGSLSSCVSGGAAFHFSRTMAPTADTTGERVSMIGEPMGWERKNGREKKK